MLNKSATGIAAKALEIRKNGTSAPEIAKALGYCRATIYRWLKKPQTRASQDRMRELKLLIREWHAAGMTVQEMVATGQARGTSRMYALLREMGLTPPKRPLKAPNTLAAQYEDGHTSARGLARALGSRPHIVTLRAKRLKLPLEPGLHGRSSRT